MKKKGQAAMEFLMTYGWAILVVLIAIGALAYFGVLNPSRFLPPSCTLMPGLSCDSFKVTQTTIELNVRNGLGNDLTLFDIGVSGCTSEGASTLNDGDTGTKSLSACSNGAAGAKFKGDLNITYTENGLSHTRTGQIVSPVE